SAVVVSGFFFFFSSRRRHTRFSRDWSSDVCSSDLKCLRRECLLPALHPRVQSSVSTFRASLLLSHLVWLVRRGRPGPRDHPGGWFRLLLHFLSLPVLDPPGALHLQHRGNGLHLRLLEGVPVRAVNSIDGYRALRAVLAGEVDDVSPYRSFLVSNMF